MFWDVWKNVQDTMAKDGPIPALAIIENNRDALAEHVDLAACLETECLNALGKFEDSYEILSKNAKIGSENYWLHYNLGGVCSKTKRMEEASAAFRTAHAIAGWQQSKDNGYYFTHDFFSPNIPDWTRWFSKFITVEPMAALEIGSWQGGSSTWLLDNIISKRQGSRLTCIDTFEGSSEHTAYIASISIEKIFDGNIEKTGFQHLCSKEKGYSQKVLQTIDDEFDFIYIDGAHEAKYVIQDAFLCWSRLRVGGFMLFDDYPFTFHDSPQQNTAVAVDQFISWNESEIEVVERGRQLLLKRIPTRI